MNRNLDFLDGGPEITDLRACDGRVLVRYRSKLIPYPPTPEEIAALIWERDNDPREAAIRRQLQEAQRFHEEKWRKISECEEQEQSSPRRSLQAGDIDSMTGEEFEEFLIGLFTETGYVTVQVSSTMSSDFGVDIILKDNRERPSIMIAVQAKRHSGCVGIEAVQQVFAGKRHHGCKSAVVVSNSTFSDAAVELARSTGVTLVDGDELKKLLSQGCQRPFG